MKGLQLVKKEKLTVETLKKLLFIIKNPRTTKKAIKKLNKRQRHKTQNKNPTETRETKRTQIKTVGHGGEPAAIPIINLDTPIASSSASSSSGSGSVSTNSASTGAPQSARNIPVPELYNINDMDIIIEYSELDSEYPDYPPPEQQQQQPSDHGVPPTPRATMAPPPPQPHLPTHDQIQMQMGGGGPSGGRTVTNQQQQQQNQPPLTGPTPPSTPHPHDVSGLKMANNHSHPLPHLPTHLAASADEGQAN
ncbi:atrophin-1-like [Anopheles bellator]|uniref:atrophin-1-like n=1 Tax=Anopheles bellator TaxID=139047 RepID=UPI002646FD13|nr:atrophin-1-like [Anopheles bellator]